MKFFLFILLYFSTLHGEIQLIKKENADFNTTLLVIGGIHGDEPGGYFAASILATHYEIESKNLWIVPNLNQKSIQQNSRGIYGDMNRKFSAIKENDSDKQTIEEIKKIILEEKVSLILNLHDGHGFYRKEKQGNIFNPNAWGQTCVIDQCKLKENQPFGNLDEIASLVKENLNKKLLKSHHSFDVRNTNTKFDDEAMQLSLTYFAVTNNKPAFAIESSKNLSSLSEKVFYQLLAIEEFMKIMDIKFTRKFDMNEKEINTIIEEYGFVSINNNISLNLKDIKNSLSFIPIKSIDNLFSFSSPLGSVEYSKGKIEVFIANKKLTELKPQYFKLSDSCPDTYKIEIDGNVTSVEKASSFFVNDDFKILKNDGVRVNVIGYYSKGVSNEEEIRLKQSDMSESFSLDTLKKVYRVEFYKDDEFCTTLMVKFK
ncbi:MAG: M99 family carboxypeptidase catalytic domain-containing protein [Sulfurimonas sp.]|nr:M99 family carboxypeptidase catalytic domain-containing protein [Sulfurimonas sp.]MDD3060180.1 M99 family carboxypeptidase catalytic domain-containing protein [Sulfurimonas sp.]MDD5202289.1 M99 family carboxypeptidase catalytic domain-containing protein [Sulfurimonas sp.]